jgi:hypothetical protein
MSMASKRHLLANFASLLLLVGIACYGTQAQDKSSAPATNTFTRDASGLEAQFEPFLQAYAGGDSASLDHHFAIFAIPDPASWFGGNFLENQVEQLVWDYEAEVPIYERSLLLFMKRSGKRTRLKAHCSLANPQGNLTLKPRPDSVIPVKQVEIEVFRVSFTATDGRSFSQLANFVYMDGAYRYVGKGAYPFWAMADVTRK